MISKLKFSKVSNSLENLDGVLVHVLCNSPDTALYLYQGLGS